MRSRSRRAAPDARDVWIGGRRAAVEALRSGAAREVLVSRSARSSPGLREVLDAAESAGMSPSPVNGDRLDGLAQNHQGVAVRAAVPASLGEGQIRRREFGPDDVVVVLDGITDPQNLGAGARAAEAAGVSLLVIRERRSAAVTAAAVRASAGALLHLPTARVTNLARFLETLKDRGFTVVGLDEEAAETVYERPCPPGRVALVVGSEGAGISRLVGEACDLLVRLPMRGRVGSLNASAALAAVLFSYVLARSGRLS